MMDQFEGYLLSPQQRRLFLSRADNSLYRAQCAILIEGPLQSSVLMGVIQKIVEIHEIFRTTFRKIPAVKKLVQVISEAGAIDWRTVDISELDDLRQSAEIEAVFQAQGKIPLELTGRQLLRLSLLMLAPKKHLLIVTLPALCADARTLNNLINEIKVRYNMNLQMEFQLGKAIQYAQFAAWQNELQEDEYAQKGQEYWRRQLSPALDVILPFENRVEGEVNFDPGMSAFVLGPDETAKIQTIVREQNVSMADFLLSCWLTLIWKLTGQNDLVVGVLGDGRKYEEMTGAMGLYAAFLPVRSQFQAGLSFSEIMKRVNASLADARAWEEYFDWERVRGTDFDGPNSSYFSVEFEFGETPTDYDSHAVFFSPYKQYVCIDEFKIKLSCSRKQNSLVLELHYNCYYYGKTWIDYIARYFKTLLHNASADIDLPIGRLKLLGEVESKQLIENLRNIPADIDPGRCLNQLFEDQVECTPDRIAAVYQDHQLSYGELNTRANQLAHYLIMRAVGADVPVGLYVARSLEMLVGLIGILKAGGAYLPLDPSHPRGRLIRMLLETKAPVLVTEASMLNQVADYQGQIVCLDRDRRSLEEESINNLHRGVTPQNLCYIMYTSGSTGVPKGVAVTHQGLVSYTSSICQKFRFSVDQALRFATVSTLSADLGNTVIFPSLVTGSCLHIICYELSTDPIRLAEYFSTRPIDVLKIVPSHFRALMESHEMREVLPRKRLIFGGEQLSLDLIERISKQSAECMVNNHYGPTETTVGALVFDPGNHPDEAHLGSVFPVGRPLANAEIYLLDRDLEPTPIGVLGEIYIGGFGLTRGYIERPDHTAEHFIPHPFSDAPHGKILYKTGDLARYRLDGNIEFFGRLDDQVKINGYRIELGEIKMALKRHPEIRECVVMVQEDDLFRKRLIAYLVPEQNHKLMPDELRAFLGRTLPEPMIPSTFVTLTALPLTANGKVDSQALVKMKGTQITRKQVCAMPGTPTEQKLTQIWSDVLKLKQVGIHDNFFELGGDSILSIRVVAGANQNGLRLTPKQVFEYPTIAQLALIAEQRVAAEANQSPITGEVCLTPIQLRFFEGHPIEPNYFNQAVLLEPTQALARAKLGEAVRQLLLHHDALRMRFENREGTWREFYSAPDTEVPLVEVDLSELEETERLREMEAVARQLQGSLNLSDGPILRIGLFSFGKRAPGRVLWVIHHLVVDGVSWRILLEDLETSYGQIVRGEKVTLPSRTSSYKQWSERLKEYAQTDSELAAVEHYWGRMDELGDVKLPLDSVGGINSVESVRQVMINLESGQTDALLREVPKAYNTQINDVLLTALAQTLCEWAGGRRIWVDLEGHGREDLFADIDLTRTVGWFTSHLPIRLELESLQEGPGESLKTIKEQLRRAPMGGVGYALLRYLRGATDLGKKLKSFPEPEVSFNYLGQLDHVLDGSRLFRPAREGVGPSRGTYERRRFILEIVGWVAEGVLRFNWSYSENFHDRATIEKVSARYLATLQEIIRHCLLPGVKGFTPSDFPYAGLSQATLDRVIAAIATDETRRRLSSPMSGEWK